MTAYEQFVEDNWFSKETTENREYDILRDLYIMSTGLAGETGEVLEHLKKYVRDGNLDLDALKKELGDMHCYWTKIVLAFGFTTQEVEDANIDKLTKRRQNGTLRGNGDNR